MKWFHVLILGIFLSLPLVGNAVVYVPSADVISYENKITKKKEKPRKKLKRWLKNHPGTLILGGFSLAGITMFILGLVWKTRWLWMTGLFTFLVPWILIFIILILIFVVGFGHKKPLFLEEETAPQEKTDSEKKKDTK